MGYLLDTSIIVRACSNAASFQSIDGALGLLRQDFQPAISIITQGEILAFGKKRGWGADKLRKLEQIISGVVVLNIDHSELVERYSELEAQNAKGLNIGQNDLWIAATAIA